MKYFENYTSNTCAGSGNQHFFIMKEGEVRTGRGFYKIAVGGKYNYSILFSNIMDSTYADGKISHKNLICDSWTIIDAKIGKCVSIDINQKEMEVSDLTPITFDGKTSKEVAPGEFFSSDPVNFEFEKGEYLCLEMTYSGKMIPYHEETLLPVFVKNGDKWEYSKYMPFAGMIGCDRQVKARIGFLGDSITQGIGTEINSYEHWNARLAEKLGEDYAFWNMGIGYGRANDAASDGAWLYKAKQNDIVVVCYGVNDIMQGMSEEQIKADLTAIVDKLKKDGKKVILQTVPPFDYTDEKIEKWEHINDYIKTALINKADMIFDAASYLSESKEKPYNAKFGGHPDAKGCKIWANALYPKMKEFLDKI